MFPVTGLPSGELEWPPAVNKREFLRTAGAGLGLLLGESVWARFADLPAGRLADEAFCGATSLSAQSRPPDVTVFLRAASTDAREADRALTELAAAWRPGYTPILVDLARFILPPRPTNSVGQTGTVDLTGIAALGDPEDRRSGVIDLSATPAGQATPPARARLTRFLEQRTGQRFGDDLGKWREWMWRQPYDPHPEYMAFKAQLYARVDPPMSRFFTNRATIRLDEIDWGGVKVNGIPPLVGPKVIAAADARWLNDSHVVFGIVIQGEARAYPKRILAWHEMARDRLGGVDLTIVYCTLCGTVIPYDSVVGGTRRTFGTSGLLYRSNKLMFDEESMSLWSTLDGAPVVGALAGSPLRLNAHPVVTTTWGEWRRANPRTTVLSLDTGHQRDYSEGAAYRDYFATDRLMFRVPVLDNRLRNKDEILGLILPAEGGGRHAVAFAADFLRRTPVYHGEFGAHRLVVLTSPQGANRVYDAGGHRFTAWSGPATLKDATGATWDVGEEALVRSGPSPVRLPRRTAFRAFWFGWFAQFPDTELVK